MVMKMTDLSTDDDPTRPGAASVARSAAIAFVLALIATVTFVLPAEFGVDPTGLGTSMGLMQLGAIENSTAGDSPAASTPLVVGAYPGIPAEFDFFEPDVLGEPFSRTHDGAYRSDTMTISLDVGEQVEVKAVMERGDALIYEWSVDDGIVYTDFHADPGENAAGYPDRYFIRYRESETANSAGSLVAPFDGNHGWYWLNIEEHPVTITLEVSGYYSRLGEIFRSYQ